MKIPTNNGGKRGAMKDIDPGDLYEAGSAIGKFLKALGKIIKDARK